MIDKWIDFDRKLKTIKTLTYSGKAERILGDNQYVMGLYTAIDPLPR